MCNILIVQLVFFVVVTRKIELTTCSTVLNSLNELQLVTQRFKYLFASELQCFQEFIGINNCWVFFFSSYLLLYLFNLNLNYIL